MADELNNVMVDLANEAPLIAMEPAPHDDGNNVVLARAISPTQNYPESNGEDESNAEPDDDLNAAEETDTAAPAAEPEPEEQDSAAPAVDAGSEEQEPNGSAETETAASTENAEVNTEVSTSNSPADHQGMENEREGATTGEGIESAASMGEGDNDDILNIPFSSHYCVEEETRKLLYHGLQIRNGHSLRHEKRRQCQRVFDQSKIRAIRSHTAMVLTDTDLFDLPDKLRTLLKDRLLPIWIVEKGEAYNLDDLPLAENWNPTGLYPTFNEPSLADVKRDMEAEFSNVFDVLNVIRQYIYEVDNNINSNGPHVLCTRLKEVMVPEDFQRITLPPPDDYVDDDDAAYVFQQNVYPKQDYQITPELLADKYPAYKDLVQEFSCCHVIIAILVRVQLLLHKYQDRWSEGFFVHSSAVRNTFTLQEEFKKSVASDPSVVSLKVYVH